MGIDIDLVAELGAIKAHRAMARRRLYHVSKLARYRCEIVALRKMGASLADIALWLRRKRLIVADSTISRYLRKLPEMES